jgi:hypothetical protein
MKVYLNCPGASEFDSASTQPTTPFPGSCAVHHQFTTRFTLRALRALASHAMVQQTVDSISGLEHKGLNSLAKNNMEAP